MVTVRHVVRNPNSWGIAGLAIATVLVLAFRDAAHPSPGPLSAVHAQVAGLAAADRCNACHGNPGESLAVACLKCHQPLAEQIASHQGVHGQLAAGLVQDCASCHSEHHGLEFQPVNARSFELARLPAREAFAHQGLAFQLHGRHASLACKMCHPLADVQVLPEGRSRFLGQSQACTACHRDVHHGSYGSDCEACHGQDQPFSRVAEFEHVAAFPLTGAHGQAGCRECHRPETPYAVAALLAVDPRDHPTRLATRSCQACHPSPHSRRFLELTAPWIGLPVSLACSACHPAVHGGFRGPLASVDRELHAQIGFPLDRPHDQAACIQCHPGYGTAKAASADAPLGSPPRKRESQWFPASQPADKVACAQLHEGLWPWQESQLQPTRSSLDYLTAFPGRDARDCHACHGDPHQGQFRSSGREGFGRDYGTRCLDCHQQHAFRPARFDLDRHQETRFPLVGAHARLECSACHRPGDVAAPLARGESQPIVYRGTPTDCRACHADPHTGQFTEGEWSAHDCRACHNQESFRFPTFSIREHARTAFPLSGAHQAVACQSCHPPQSGKDLLGSTTAAETGLPRTHDRLQFSGTPHACEACHADVHDGQFHRAGLPRTVNGHLGCARCHSTERFDRVSRQQFDHDLWTGYPLVGRHATLECKACHLATAPGVGRKLGRVRGRNCQACHADPHVAQFGPSSQVDCTRCHTERGSFQDLLFRHDQHSRFPLDATHRDLACSACHRRQRLSDGSTAVRYRPLGTECGDCHVPSGAPSRRSGRP